jgi:predicted nucleotidyltransferase
MQSIRARTVPVKSKQEVLELLRGNSQTLRRLGVRRIGLFGSFVRDEATRKSDVDLLVEFEAGQETFDNFMELGFFLEDQMGRRVETVTPESLSPYIGPHILREVENVRLDS